MKLKMKLNKEDKYRVEVWLVDIDKVETTSLLAVCFIDDIFPTIQDRAAQKWLKEGNIITLSGNLVLEQGG